MSRSACEQQWDALHERLRPFQRQTVERACEALLATTGSRRFLVADEVGLGKTLVARAVVLRMWREREARGEPPPRVVYVCNSSLLARQNVRRLVPGADAEHQRLALRALRLPSGAGQARNQPELLSLTPQTSFKLRGAGRVEERALLVALLERLPELRHWTKRRRLEHLLRGRVGEERWAGCLEEARVHAAEASNTLKVARGLRGMLKRRRIDEGEYAWDALLGLLEEVLVRSGRVPEELLRHRDVVVATLRRCLAAMGVRSLAPDLVVFDEFHQFADLLPGGAREGLTLRGEEEEIDEELASPAEEAAALVRLMVEEAERTARRRAPVPVLLLSATPYRVFTTRAGRNGDHHQDFLRVLRFLFGEEADGEVASVESDLQHFRSRVTEMLRAPSKEQRDDLYARALKRKEAVERRLRRVIARTERVAFTRRADAMVESCRDPVVPGADDARHYLLARRLAERVEARDPLRLVKSVPHPLHFLHGYELDERLKKQGGLRRLGAVAGPRPHLLRRETLQQFKPLGRANGEGLGHPFLRRLLGWLVEHRAHERLWMPPSAPYGTRRGEGGSSRSDHEFSKVLVFSGWRAVPEAVAGLLGYELERMARGKLASDTYHAETEYTALDLDVKQAPRRVVREALLLVPFPGLAEVLHPLRGLGSGRPLAAWARSEVRKRLGRRPRLPAVSKDPRAFEWTWICEEGRFGSNGRAASLLGAWQRAPRSDFLQQGRRKVAKASPVDRGLGHLASEWDRLERVEGQPLQREQYDQLVDLLVDIAWGAPATIAWRTLGAVQGLSEELRWRASVRLAKAFWKLFRTPLAQDVVRRHWKRTRRGERRRDVPGLRWRQVLAFCRDHELQAVFDEVFHLAWEQTSGDRDVAERVGEVVELLVESIEPRHPFVVARRLASRGGARTASEPFRLRTRHAVRFARSDAEEGGVTQAQLRAAFDSPFHPFVLVTTSIGQEGLDFHRWSRCVMHWDLPATPVELEQREGRVHRFKGLAVRRNIAAAHFDEVVRCWTPGSDPWALLFERAERAAKRRGQGDLSPWWLYEHGGRSTGGDVARKPLRIVRWIPLLAFSQEEVPDGRLDRLLWQLSHYRLTFGQPRQEDLLAAVARSLDERDREDLEARLRNLWIDLSPRKD